MKLSEIENLRYEPEFCVASQKYNFKKSVPGIEIIENIQYGTSDELNEIQKGYPVLRLNEFDSIFIDKPTKYCNKISRDEFEALRLKQGDVLICRTNGNPDLVGKSAIVLEDSEFAYASYLFKVRTKQGILNPHSLLIFLHTKYGRNEIDKYSMTSNQTNFSPAKFKEIKVPKISGKIQEKIKLLVEQSYEYKNTSMKKYLEAEDELLKEIGFCNVQIKHKLSYSEKMSNIKKNMRLDADFYQPKYYEIEGKLNAYKLRTKELKDIIDLKMENFEPQSETKYKYIELANIQANGRINGSTIDCGKNLPSRARRLVKTGDVIVSSIEGSLESCALITDEYNDAICSTGFYVLKSESVNPETLLVFVKTLPIQNLLKKYCRGTILTSISKDELEKLPVPLIDSKVQRNIASKIKEAYDSRKKSNLLIDEAIKILEAEIKID
jgi:restriction endonuclease S subunit